MVSKKFSRIFQPYTLVQTFFDLNKDAMGKKSNLEIAKFWKEQNDYDAMSIGRFLIDANDRKRIAIEASKDCSWCSNKDSWRQIINEN